jgi:predicted MPP superfamily phosphohydrolase
MKNKQGNTVKKADKLKVAVITDIHIGKDSGARLGSKAPRLMRKFIKEVNAYNPDLIVDLGDRISSSSKEEAQENLISLKEHFNEAAAPVHFIIGNHDLKYLSANENAKILECNEKSSSIVIKDHHLIFWNPSVDAKGEEGLVVEEKDLLWLKNELYKNDKAKIIFSHVPLDGLDEDKTLEGVPKNILKRFYYSNADEIQKILENNRNVLLSIGGHRHQNRHVELNGVSYITQQSLTSTYRKHYRIPHGTYSLIESTKDGLKYKLKGKVKKDLSI